MKKTIAVVNQKGGVGKTTSTINLAWALAAQGRTVLMIDLDPQASLTVYTGQDENALEAAERTLYYGLLHQRPLTELLIPLDGQRSLLASGITLSSLERELILDAWHSPRTLLREKLQELSGRFDHILIDCPPTLSLLTVNGLVAADWVLIPVKTDFLSIKGIEGLLATIEEVRTRANYDLDILGVLPTLYNCHNRHDNAYLEQLRAVMGEVPFFTPINRSTRYDQAAAEARPTLQAYPDTPGVQAYHQLAAYILQHYAQHP